MTDNGQQLKVIEIKEKYKSYIIKHALSTPRYAKSNGQEKVSNKTILYILKKKLDAHKDLWAK